MYCGSSARCRDTGDVRKNLRLCHQQWPGHGPEKMYDAVANVGIKDGKIAVIAKKQVIG